MKIWIKALFKMHTPAIIRPYLPLDGALSYAYAKLTGFKYENEEGFIYDNLPVNRYKYIDELPIEKTFYDNGKWFYNISAPIYNPSDKKTFKTTITRKYIEDIDLWSIRFPNIENVKWSYKDKFGKGKEKSYLIAVDTFYVPEFYVLMQIDEENENQVYEILENVKAIGKKTNQGYGFVEFIDIEDVDVKNFVYEDKLIRPVPKTLIEDKDYFELKLRLFTPYYVKNEKYTDVCYVDRMFFE